MDTNLSNANLSHANLLFTNSSRANLRGATLLGTLFDEDFDFGEENPPQAPMAPAPAPSIITYQNVDAKPIDPSEVVIPEDEQGYDYIQLYDVSIHDYIKEDPDNVVFLSYNRYCATTKTIVNNMIKDPKNIKYECTELNRMGTVVKTVPFLNAKSFGLVTDTLLDLGELKTVLTTPDIKALEIIPGRKLLTTASLDVLENNASHIGASHCQKDQDGTVCELKNIHIDISGGNRPNKIKSKRKTHKRKTHKRKTHKRKTHKRINI